MTRASAKLETMPVMCEVYCPQLKTARIGCSCNERQRNAQVNVAAARALGRGQGSPAINRHGRADRVTSQSRFHHRRNCGVNKVSMSDFIGVKVSVWRWAWTQMRRDWRSGSMRFLLVSVVLAVTALSAVAFLPIESKPAWPETRPS